MTVQDLTVEELQKIVTKETRHYLKALEQGESNESLSEIRDTIKLCTQLLEIKMVVEKIPEKV